MLKKPMIFYKIQKRHTSFFSKMVMLVFLLLLLGSCNALPLRERKMEVYNILNKIAYPYQEITNQKVSHSVGQALEDDEISTLKYWKKSMPVIKNFLQSDCVGCVKEIAQLKPIYRVEKGRYIHFGLQDDLGVQNLVFKKNRGFIGQFYMFQGESKEQIHDALKNIKKRNHVIEGVYPTEINSKNIYLKQMEINHNSVDDNQWYKPMFPTKIGYAIELKKKNNILRFRFEGGLYSYQRPDKNGRHQIINFVQPLIYANAVGIDEPISYSSFTKAYYANATFFMLNLEEEAEVSIHIESNTAEKTFRFSVLENDGFYTMDEYLKKEEIMFDQYQYKLVKGKYLIRVLHDNSDYDESPLYTLKIDKKNVL